ncbi:MAG: aldo/keto reductase [Verrucomicrobiota bacterium]
MQYRRFGRTEIQMPVFSCGGMRYQQSWNDIAPADVPKANQENLEATIRRSLEVGINHIETARGYGSSEMQLGWILPKLPRDEMIIQTKVAPTADPKEFESVLEQSLSLLQLDHVDLLGIHGINNEELLDWTVREGGCMEVARRYQKEGRVRHIGFSTHSPEPVITKAIETDAFDYVNLHWYYIFQDNWPSIEAATQRDMGVFIISPNDKGGQLYNPTPKLVELCAPLSPMAFNDLFCLLRPEVHTLSLGASRPTDFDEHLKALDHYDQAAELIPTIAAKLRAHAIDKVGEDWLDHFLDDIPRWNLVPGEVNLRVILRLWTLVACYDMVEYGKARYNLLGNAEHWFPGKNLKNADYAALEGRLAQSRFSDVNLERLKEAHKLLGGSEKKRLSQSD